MTVRDLINKDIVCCCGRTHRCDIGFLEIGVGAIEKLPEAVKNYKKILLVADSNTYPLCGERVKTLLGDKLCETCIFETDDILVPDEKTIAAIEEYADDDTDFVLGIGSGVINDLCKYVAFSHGIKSGIIATAPSMDGYASSGAAMILSGMKVTITAKAPDVIIADVDILKNAPADMISAGYADIIGKYSALCDWKLAELVNGEYLCEYVYAIVMEATDKIRSLAGSIMKREPDAIGYLAETLVLIGVCLSLLSTTRPGSGSEHHMSHYFEITGLIDDKPYFLHGTDVGYSTIVTAELREKILEVENPEFHRISDEAKDNCYRKIYKDYCCEVAEIQKKAGWYEKNLEAEYSAKWNEIREILAECPTGDEIREMLLEVGFDLAAFERMYGVKKIHNGIYFAKDLKDRYSVLWLYASLFLTEKEAENI